MPFLHIGGILQTVLKTDMLPLSVVMIAKNEELLLPQTIKSVAMLTDDILICDTGSTDNTLNTAIENGARAMHLQW